jgi:hypothetical protein
VFSFESATTASTGTGRPGMRLARSHRALLPTHVVDLAPERRCFGQGPLCAKRSRSPFEIKRATDIGNKRRVIRVLQLTSNLVKRTTDATRDRAALDANPCEVACTDT